MIETGKLTERIRFEKRGTKNDGYGNTQDEWSPAFVMWAQKRPLVGGETVMANRLQGTQPVVITVRAMTFSREITSDWRAVDERTGQVYNIRSVTPSEDRAHIDFLAEAGVASG